MPPVGFEPTISAGERLKTYVLDRAANRTGYIKIVTRIKQTVIFSKFNNIYGLVGYSVTNGTGRLE